MSKLKTIVAFAAGYIVGARAGHGRYEEIKNRAKEMWEKPAVQEQVEKVSEGAKKVAHDAKQHLPGTDDPEESPEKASSAATGRATSSSTPPNPTRSSSEQDAGVRVEPQVPRSNTGKDHDVGKDRERRG